MIRVFYIEITDKMKYGLRRYGDGPCPLKNHPKSIHDKTIMIDDVCLHKTSGDLHDHHDPRWPKHCDCGYEFKDSDKWIRMAHDVYKRYDTGEEMFRHDAPVGACWDETWWTEDRTYPDFYIGEDGRCLCVRTPGGDWTIDARASNCTMPKDKTHKCWVRHGRPEDGTLHVDKNGYTCAAGAGSIVLGNYHGFLHNGYLTPC